MIDFSFSRALYSSFLFMFCILAANFVINIAMLLTNIDGFGSSFIGQLLFYACWLLSIVCSIYVPGEYYFREMPSGFWIGVVLGAELFLFVTVCDLLFYTGKLVLLQEMSLFDWSHFDPIAFLAISFSMGAFGFLVNVFGRPPQLPSLPYPYKGFSADR